MYKIKTDNKNELLCVLLIVEMITTNNLLDSIVELCDKRVDKLLCIGHVSVPVYDVSYRYRYTVSVFTLDNGKSQSSIRQHGGTPLVVEYRSGESESKFES